MTSSTKKTFLKYRVTYLEMEKRPSFAYPSLSVKSVVLLEVEKVPLWYFISIYREVGYKYEWTDILKQPKKITKKFINDKNVIFFSLLEKVLQ